MLFSRTMCVLLSVILRNCFAAREKVSNGKEIRSRFVRSKCAQQREIAGVAIRRRQRAPKTITYLIAPRILSAGKRNGTWKRVPKKETRQLDVKWLGDLNASVLRVDAGTSLWNTHARHPLGPPIKGDYAALPFERGIFHPDNICRYLGASRRRRRRRTLAE